MLAVIGLVALVAIVIGMVVRSREDEREQRIRDEQERKEHQKRLRSFIEQNRDNFDEDERRVWTAYADKTATEGGK